MEKTPPSKSSRLPKSLRRAEANRPGMSSSLLPLGASLCPTIPGPACGTPWSCIAPHPSAGGSAVSALQSKVKALSERKTVRKERDDRGLAPGSSQAHTDRKVLPILTAPGLPACGRWQLSNSDDEGEPLSEEHVHPGEYPTPGSTEVQSQVLAGDTSEGGPDSLLTVPLALCDGANGKTTLDVPCNFQEEPLSAKSWSPPRAFWKVARPETLLLNGETLLKQERPCSYLEAQTMTSPTEDRCVRRELHRSDSLESHLRWCLQSKAEPAAPLGGLWRADSWESVCSSGSSLSLAERVEMNRAIVRQVLNKRKNKDTEGMEHQIEDAPEYATKGLAVLSDSDWDSGISLQDSEHCSRAFVLSDDLPLSPRHEQAKRLLERARMKARSNPLKADHSILPVPRDNPEFLPRAAVPLRRALLSKEGVSSPAAAPSGPASGNLSDSSSSDSTCGPRRRHGQSPTRVRFEDESEKDAEVRYLERLRQRRRAGERAQGLLVSKPNLSSYVNGKKEGEATRAADHGFAPECMLNNRAARAVPQEAIDRKCNSCGNAMDSVNNSSNPVLSQTGDANQECQGKTGPCWLSPVYPNRTVRTERIKETYIGEVTSVEHLSSDRGHSGEKGSGTSAHVYVQKVGGSTDSDTQGNFIVRPKATGAELHPTSGAEVLPPNPYAVEQSGATVKPCHCPGSLAATATQAHPLVDANCQSQHRDSSGTPQPKKSALKLGPRNRQSGQRAIKLMPSSHYRLIHLDCPESLEPSLPQRAAQDPLDPAPVCQCQEEQVCSRLGHGEESPSLSSSGPAPCIRPSMLKYPPARALPDQSALEAAGHYHQGNGDQSHDPTALQHGLRCGGDGRMRGPVRVEHLREDSSDMAHEVDPQKWAALDGPDQREGRPKLSLRRFFSAIGLNSMGKLVKGRSSSMEQLSFVPRHSPASPSPTHRQHGPLKKAPSLQTLHVGSPLTQLRKASSVQSLQSPKRKPDRSSTYIAAEQTHTSVNSREFHRTLSVEDVGCPSRVRSVGRVAQAFPDGTLLLELSRPSDGPFGFLISRGKGRPDSGVYVEEMGDSSMQKLYAGLLGIGDEILEVNGEKVAGLSLDQVTRLMTQDSTASIRVLRHRRFPR